VNKWKNNGESSMSSELMVSDRNQGFMAVSTIEEALRVSELIATSNFCPTSMKGKPGDILVCLQFGQELGLKPMAAIQNIAVINGRPSIWGDAMIAVCRQSPAFEYIKEDFDPVTMTATCTVKRKNEPEFISTFSQADAKTANLWGKAGPWTNYPKRMLQMRARGFALRDCFPDLLRGIILKEEAEDYDTEKKDYSRVVGVTVESEANFKELVTEDHILELDDLLFELDGDIKKTLEHLNIKEKKDMSIQQWSEVTRQMRIKLRDKRKIESLPINMHVQETMTESAKEFFGEDSE
jgi:hypothetical protein